MNKALFLLFFGPLFLISCSQKKDQTIGLTSGKINSVSVIIDDQLWKGELGDSIRNKFASPVIGLPQEEPLFTLNQYPVKLLEGYMTNSRNIIVVKKEKNSQFFIAENEYAKPQNVIHISGRTTQELLDTLENNTAKIIEIIRKTELAENQRTIDTLPLNTKRLERKFRLQLKVPEGYKYVMERRKFIWLKKEIQSGNMSLLIYQVPLSTIRNKNVLNTIIRMRDSVGRLYIHGKARATRMITERAYAPYFKSSIFEGRKTFETKGTWEMKNDYMSGPFINYAIIDKKNNRLLVLEGFCYAPSKEKRDLMFELEASIKSAVLLKKIKKQKR